MESRPAWARKQIENFTLICRNDHAPTTGGHLPQENTATFSDYSIDLTPRRFALLADTCAFIKWESAHAFIRPAACSIAIGADTEKRELPPYPPFFFFLSYDPTKTRLHRTRGGAKSRGDTDSHGPSVSLCTQPLSILFDLTPRTSHVNPSTYPHSFSYIFSLFRMIYIN